MQLVQGGDKEKLLPLLDEYFHEMAKDIKKQWKRLGGKWAVCHIVATRKHRDQIREDLNMGADFGRSKVLLTCLINFLLEKV